MSRATERLIRDRRMWFGGGVVVLLVVLAIAAPLVARHNPIAVDLINSLQPPSWNHWFGTDILGSFAPQIQFVVARQDYKAAGVPDKRV